METIISAKTTLIRAKYCNLPRVL